MAKALQCPECGERHPLAELTGTKTFRCSSCGRLLKVPASAAAREPARGAKAGADPDATAAMPAAGGAGAKVPPSQRGVDFKESEPKRRAEPAGSTPRVPKAVRVVAWLVAVPAGLLPVLVVGRLSGLLNVEAAVDIFIGVGWGRFLVPLLVLPVWAAVTATVAHVLIEGAARLLERD